MKTSRSQLKAIVKECLVEILTEGLGGFAPQQSVQSQLSAEGVTRRPQQQLTRQQRPSPLDEPVSQGRIPSAALKEAIKREAGGNKMMAEIFADTAKKTLPNMLSGGDTLAANPGNSGPGTNQQEQFHGTPEQVFGEDNAAKWAHLAFTDGPTKKSA